MSVLLKGRNGNELELAFVRDELPDPQDGFGDRAWFTSIVRAATGDEGWAESSPCINAYEFRNLAEWLEAVANEQGGEVSEVELLEPELRFSVMQRTPKGIGIRVAFHLVDRPEEFGVNAETDEAEFVDLFVDGPQLRGAAAELRAELEEFERIGSELELGDEVGAGDEAGGELGVPDETLNIIDRIDEEPPGAGTGEDNAGER